MASAAYLGITYMGALEFRDMHPPIPGMDEWGINTLRRTIKGPLTLLAATEQSLEQGQKYGEFFLQSWEPIEDKIFGGFSLLYKGLTRGLPKELYVNDRFEACGSISADNLKITVASLGKVIVAGTREVKYEGPATLYRYIRDKEPDGPSFSQARGTTGIVEIESRITATFDDGTTKEYSGYGAPAGLVSALATSTTVNVNGPQAVKVVGTPFWECQDLVRVMLKSR